MIDIIEFWSRSLVHVTQEKKLEAHREDSVHSKQCPIYVRPIKESFQLSFTEKVTMEWLGGGDFNLVAPDWWTDIYTQAKMRWLGESSLGKDTFLFRYAGERPLGSESNCAGHAGGMVVNFFTGLSIKTDEGLKCLVTRPFNVFSPVVTVQDGIYDTDTYPGEFSVNFQFLLQNRKVVWQAGQPFASLFFYREEPDKSFRVSKYGSEAWLKQHDKANVFYTAKTEKRCPYHKNPANILS
jgi:hypothetical protein